MNPEELEKYLGAIVVDNDGVKISKIGEFYVAELVEKIDDSPDQLENFSRKIKKIIHGN